jgi:hypothetical protein
MRGLGATVVGTAISGFFSAYGRSSVVGHRSSVENEDHAIAFQRRR